MTPRYARWCAVLVIVLAATVRLWDLGGRSFSALEVARINAAEQLTISPESTDNFDPFPLWLTHLMLRYGYREGVVRLPAALAGAAALGAMWLLGKQLLGWEGALYVTLLLAASPLHIQLSRLVGPDPWLVLAMLAGILALWHALRGWDAVRPWLAVGVAGCLACVCGYAGLLLPVIVAAAILIAAERQRRCSIRRSGGALSVARLAGGGSTGPCQCSAGR